MEHTVNALARKQASKPASKPASKQASKQASKLASKQANLFVKKAGYTVTGSYIADIGLTIALRN